MGAAWQISLLHDLNARLLLDHLVAHLGDRLHPAIAIAIDGLRFGRGKGLAALEPSLPGFVNVLLHIFVFYFELNFYFIQLVDHLLHLLEHYFDFFRLCPCRCVIQRRHHILSKAILQCTV